jgi:hypothetical protein
MCVFLSTTFVWNISHSEKNWARYDLKCILVFMYSTGYSCVILQWNLNFLDRFFENTWIWNLINIRWVGADLFHAGGRADGRTDKHDEAVTFRSFANAPKMISGFAYWFERELFSLLNESKLLPCQSHKVCLNFVSLLGGDGRKSSAVVRQDS